MTSNADYGNIPFEMKTYRQWVVWKYQQRDGNKPTKVPYSCYTGRIASVTDSSTWGLFEDVVPAYFDTDDYDGIGFVLTRNDPYVFIDLDDTKGDAVALARQVRIYEAFDSYSERSPSGNGLHIITKGHIASGCRRGCVEMYASERYMTMTGDIYGLRKTIEYRQLLVEQLWSEMGGRQAINNRILLNATTATESDQQILERASNAQNGWKFKCLWNGDGSILNSFDRSDSVIDQALVGILQFYTQDPAQIERLWLMSPHGQREKVRKRIAYRWRTIAKAFEREYRQVQMIGGPRAPGK